MNSISQENIEFNRYYHEYYKICEYCNGSKFKVSMDSNGRRRSIVCPFCDGRGYRDWLSKIITGKNNVW
jgi:hypothetical protein